jgi:hypothetical protein
VLTEWKFKVRYTLLRPVPVAVCSKALVCGCSVAGIAGSNPADGMDVRLLCLLCVLCVVASAWG